MKKFKEFKEIISEKNVPTSPEKWARAKAAAKSKFAVYPSAYANGWASKKYKSMGGGWRSTQEEVELEEIYHDPWKDKHFGPTKVIKQKYKVKTDTKTYNVKADSEKHAHELVTNHAPGSKIVSIEHKGRFMEQVEEKDDGDDLPEHEVEVFDYDTNYFHICPSATKLYKDIEDKVEPEDHDLFEGMAKLQDCIFFIEQHLTEKKGSAKEDDMGYLLMAQNIKDQLDLMLSMTTPEMRMEHGYLQGHIEVIKELLDWENRKEELDEQYEWLEESAAWKRKEGKSPTGGLNAKGIASYRRENPGSKLSMAVTGKVKAGSKAAKRRKSFCARMGGMPGPMKKPNGEPTRKSLALSKWKCR